MYSLADMSLNQCALNFESFILELECCRKLRLKFYRVKFENMKNLNRAEFWPEWVSKDGGMSEYPLVL